MVVPTVLHTNIFFHPEPPHKMNFHAKGTTNSHTGGQEGREEERNWKEGRKKGGKEGKKGKE